MLLNRDRQKFVKSVGILIVLQGLTWFTLSVAAIIVKRSQPDNLTTNDWSIYTTYTSYLSRIIYDDFMVDSTRARVVRPQDFEAFMWIYAILSAVWVAASLDQNLAIKYKKSRQSSSSLVLGVAILITSVIDLVFVALLARDLTTCPFDISLFIPSSEATTTSTPEVTTTATTTTTTTTVSPTTEETTSPTTTAAKLLLYAAQSTNVGTLIDCQVANGIIMTIAARGYVLWLINVILGIALINIGAQALKPPTLRTYANNGIPRVRMPELRKAPSPNESALFEDNNVFPPPAPPMSENRNRTSTPVALNNKNQGIYFY